MYHLHLQAIICHTLNFINFKLNLIYFVYWKVLHLLYYCCHSISLTRTCTRTHTRTHTHTHTHTQTHILRIIYTGAMLPILSYGAPVWIEGLKRKHNATKLKRVQRLINIKITRAYRTTSHEALCVLTGITPILIETEKPGKNLLQHPREHANRTV